MAGFNWFDWALSGLALAAFLVFCGCLAARPSFLATSGATSLVVSYALTALLAISMYGFSQVFSDGSAGRRTTYWDWARAWTAFAVYHGVLGTFRIVALAPVPDSPLTEASQLGWVVITTLSMLNSALFLFSGLTCWSDKARQRKVVGVSVIAVVGVALTWLLPHGGEPIPAFVLPDSLMSGFTMAVLTVAHMSLVMRFSEHVAPPHRRTLRFLGGSYIVGVYFGYAVVQLAFPAAQRDSLTLAFVQTLSPLFLVLFGFALPVILLLREWASRAERELEEQAAVARTAAGKVIDLERFLEKAGYAYWEEDSAGRTTLSSARELEFLGYQSEDALRGKPRSSTVWMDPEEARKFEEKVLSGPGVAVERLRLRTRSGYARWVEAIAARVGEEMTPSVAGIYRDIGPLREDEGLYEAAQRFAAELDDLDGAMSKLLERTVAATAATGGCLLLPMAGAPELLVAREATGVLAAFAEGEFHTEPAPARGSGERNAQVRSYGDANCARCRGDCPSESMDAGGACVRLPIVGGEGLAGVFWLSFGEPPELTPKRRVRLKSFCDQVGLVLERAGGIALADRRARLVRGFDPNSPPAALDSHLQGAMVALRRHLRVAHWLVFVREDDAARPRLRLSAHDFPKPLDLRHRLGSVDGPEALWRENSDGADVLASHDPQRIESLVRRLTSQDDVSFHGLLGVPLFGKGEKLNGIIFWIDATGKDGRKVAFTSLSLRMAQQFADLVGLLFNLAVMNSGIRTYWLQVVHELSSPVVGIRAEIDAARQYLDEDSRKTTRHRLDGAMLNADVLRRQINMFEAMDAGLPFKTKERLVGLRGAVLQRISREVAPWLTDQGLDPDRIIIDASTQLPKIRVDPEALSLAVYNLFRNAVRYAYPDRDRFRIEVTAYITDEHLEICFQDQGIGIPEGWEERIFERGERAPNAAAWSVHGLGLGLAVVRRVLEEHGGDASLTHRRDPTEFRLRLPRSRLLE